jgi:SAM-dependent methyltransferase
LNCCHKVVNGQASKQTGSHSLKTNQTTLIFFDRHTNFYPLDSSLLSGYRVELDPMRLARPPEKGSTVITDGQSYFAVPKEILEREAPQPDIDLKMIQDYFFTDDAKEAALNIGAEALESIDRGSLTYGTTGAKSLYQALTRVAAGPDDRFLDIGCGCGLPVLIGSHFVGHARGVDIVNSMIEFAKRAAFELRRPNTTFQVANVRDVDIADADIVYVAGTTMSDDLRRVIGRRMTELRPGAVVISLTFPFQSDELVLIDTFHSPFAWWDTTTEVNHQFFIHLRSQS